MSEKKASRWMRVGQILIDIPEKHVPSVAFSVLFLVFMLQVFFRYVLNRPLIWPQEISVFAFIWTVVLGACFAKRDNAHVVFSLVYDRQRPIVQLYFRIIGNLLLVTAFCIALVPSFEYIEFMKHDRTVDLQIRKDIVFGPYMVFLVIISVRVALDLVADIRRLARGEV